MQDSDKDTKPLDPAPKTKENNTATAEKKRKLHFLKLGILFFGISLLLLNCNDENEKHNKLRREKSEK